MSTTAQRRAITAIADLLRDRPDHHDCRRPHRGVKKESTAMSNTAPPRPVMGEDARTRYTAALSTRVGRQHGPLRVATVGEANAAAALAHRYGWTVAPDVDAADALAVALPAGMLGAAADTAVRTALRRGLPILIQIGGDLAAFPDCWVVGVPGGYRLRVPAEPGPATTATLAYLGITPASKRAAGPGHGESPEAAPDTSPPPPPVVRTAEQQAEQALRTARREVTPAAIAKLAPHPIPHDDPDKRSAWLHLVRGGMTPTPAAGAGLVADRAARRARRVQEAVDVAEIAARDGAAAAVAVARIVADTGTGPTWTELRSTLGWPRRAAREIIPKLLQAEWLTSTTDHRSLRPGPRHAPTPRNAGG